MDYGDYCWGLYRDYYRDPFPTQQQTVFGLGLGLHGFEFGAPGFQGLGVLI